MPSACPPSSARLPLKFLMACRRIGMGLSRWLLVVSTDAQSMRLLERSYGGGRVLPPARYQCRQTYRISTSRFGLGQEEGTQRTPLGLHRIAQKIGGGLPAGVAFRGRRPIGWTWEGCRDRKILHRILWLEGLEPGWNRGGNVDSRSRYIYLHGFGDETTLGSPQSSGCVHLAASDLIPLYDRLPTGTLVWIQKEGI